MEIESLVMVQSEPDYTQGSRQIGLSSTAAELRVLRTAVETAREEARRATVSAHRVARREQKWRKKYKAVREKYAAVREKHDRITSTLVWRIYSPIDRALCRVRSIMRRTRHSDQSSTSENQRDVIRETFPSSCHITDLSSFSVTAPRGRIAVVLHLYYPELWPEFREALGAIPEPFDLFVTLTQGYSDQAESWIRGDYSWAEFITLENRGRDIFPFITLVNSGVLFRYGLICKLHSKRSVHKPHGNDWRRKLVAGVLSDVDYVERVLMAFDTDPTLGIVVGDGSFRKERDWSPYLQRINELCDRARIAAVTDESEYPGYPAGSIYWIRSSLLRPIADLGLTATEFELEPLPLDGRKPWTTSCTVDAIERLIGQVCSEAGMHVAERHALISKPIGGTIHSV